MNSSGNDELDTLTESLGMEFIDIPAIKNLQRMQDFIRNIGLNNPTLANLQRTQESIRKIGLNNATLANLQTMQDSIKKIGLNNPALANLQRMQNSIKNVNFSVINQLNKQNDISIIQKQIQSFIKSLPFDDYRTLQISALQVSPSLSESIEQFYSGTLTPESDNTSSRNIHENSSSILVSNTIAEPVQNTESNSILLYIQMFLQILSILLSPISNNYYENLNEWQTEVYEDFSGANLTGETIAIIRTDTYLREGRSKNSPTVLKTKLKQAQSIIWHERKRNWIKISVYTNNKTYTGWVEKSKVLK